MRITLLIVFTLFVVASHAGRVAAQTTAPTLIDVICPAISRDERSRTNYPGESNRPVELVVIGSVKAVHAGEDLYDVTVEKVLYGSTSQKTVRFSWTWDVSGERKIIALASTPSGHPAPFEYRYQLPMNDEKSQAALAVARLDYHALAARVIFVGREQPLVGVHAHQVKIDQAVAGESPAVGTVVSIDIGDHDRSDDGKPSIREEPMIYFVKDIRAEKPEHPRQYVIDCRLPADQLPAVREALGRRELYPVTERVEYGERISEREIGFRGSIDEAVEMLASPSEGASTLAARMLIHRKDDALEPVVKAIHRDLLLQLPQLTGRFHHLAQLIQVLGAMDQGRSGGAVEKLLDQCVNQMSAQIRVNVARSAADRYWTAEEDQQDVNHALVWLAMALDPAVADSWATRLVKARDSATGLWKEELQLALTATNIEDRLEMRPALERMKLQKPMMALASTAVRGDPVAFSADGKLLAAGTHVWHTDDWSPAGGFESNFSIVGQFFSPDGQMIYYAGGGARGYLGGYDWRTGKIARTFAGVTSGYNEASFSRDAKTMATVNTYEGKANVWDTGSGKTIRTFDMPDHCHGVALSPDGKLLVLQSAEDKLTVTQLGGGTAINIALHSGVLNQLLFSPDGKWLIDTCHDDNHIDVVVYEVGSDFRQFAQAAINGQHCMSMAVSPDNAHLVINDQDGKAWCLSLPGLKDIQPLRSQSQNEGGLAFSPDGKWLAMGSRDAPVQLFHGDTFAPFFVGDGHRDEIREIHFSEDETQLRTLGESGETCLWDARTLMVLHRDRIPEGYHVAGSRGDGKYLLCREGISETYGQDGSPATAIIVDADTGRTISTLHLPEGNGGVKWIDDQQAVIASSKILCRFNYMTGQIIHTVKIDNNKIYDSNCYLTENGKSLLIINGGGKISTVEVSSVNVDSGLMAEIGKQDLPPTFANSRGVVPGGKYLYVGDQGFYVYDIQTLKVAASKPFTGADLFNLTFNCDGSRYVVATGSRIYIDNDFRQWDSEATTIIRVQETLSGRTLAAFPAPTRYLHAMAISASGRKVTLVGNDGTLQIWDIGM